LAGGRPGHPFLNSAESAASGAGISQNQEGCCFSIPALGDIGTSGTAADRIQLMLFQDILDKKEILI